MSNTVNNYTETDLGNISLNPRGEYDDSAAYEYLDTVSYRGGSYFCLAELETTITGIAPDAGRNSEYWQMIAAPGDMTPEYTAAHNDVIKKAVQVETSRAAVELAQQEIEAVQTDVQQLHSDTARAAQETENSKNSAANFAQSAEQSRKTVSESEQNIKGQIAGFDSRVSEVVEQSKEEINTTKQQAINTITNQQNTSVNTVKAEGEKIITRVGNDAKTVADDRATVEEATQTVLNNAQEVAQNTQTVASNMEKAATSAEGAKTSADNAAQSAKSVEDASKQIEQNKKDVASLKEDISTKITKLYASSQGETHLADSDNGKTMDMMLYGRSEQKQYRGKNLLPTTMYSDSAVRNGITFINNGDGSVTVSGTATDMTYFSLWGYNVLDDKGVLQGITPGDVLYVSDCLLQQTNSETIINLTSNKPTQFYDSTTTMYVAIKIDKGATVNKTYYPQIEKGSEATSYEPYVGGQPSPSPDYPQEIKSVVNPTVKVRGANLLKLDFTKKSNSGVTIDVVENRIRFHGTINSTYAYWNLDNPVLIKKGSKVSWYVDDYNDHGAFAWLRKTDDYGTLQTLNKSNPSITSNNDSYLSQIGIEGYTPGDTIDFTTTFAILDNTNQYEPYHEQTVTLPYTLNAIPVKSGGNVTIDGQQYIADYVDVEHGKVIRNILKWRLGDLKYGFNNAVWHINISKLGIDGSKIGLSNMFKIQNGHYNTVTTSEVYISYDGKIAALNMRGMTDEEFKKWLREKNPEVYNVLTVAEEIPITLEEASAFKQLMTYYPVTNISVNSEQLDGLTVFNYPISMANGWNYAKQQLNDNRDYIYDMDLQSAEAYVNSEYAVALTELEV